MIDEIKDWGEDEKPSETFDSLENANKVFVVHGHDDSARKTVARFLQGLQLKPIILHEQSSRGCTIIEKFEDYADVSFAVVLLTPDDLGALAKNRDELKHRARQNVILELGFFIGKLGRKRVCLIVNDNVEWPLDYVGVIYAKWHDAGGWKTKLTQELKVAGFNVDTN